MVRRRVVGHTARRGRLDAGQIDAGQPDLLADNVRALFREGAQGTAELLGDFPVGAGQETEVFLAGVRVDLVEVEVEL